jgi:hypothetical protein
MKHTDKVYAKTFFIMLPFIVMNAIISTALHFSFLTNFMLMFLTAWLFHSGFSKPELIALGVEYEPKLMEAMKKDKEELENEGG